MHGSVHGNLRGYACLQQPKPPNKKKVPGSRNQNRDLQGQNKADGFFVYGFSMGFYGFADGYLRVLSVIILQEPGFVSQNQVLTKSSGNPGFGCRTLKVSLSPLS